MLLILGMTGCSFNLDTGRSQTEQHGEPHPLEPEPHPPEPKSPDLSHDPPPWWDGVVDIIEGIFPGEAQPVEGITP